MAAKLSQTQVHPGLPVHGLRFALLGPFEVYQDGRLVNTLTAKQNLLLVALLARKGQLIPVDELIDDVWGDRPPKDAVNALQLSVSRLRRAADSLAIVTGIRCYRVDVADDAVDLYRFRRHVQQAHAQREAGDARSAAEQFDRALALDRGEPLGNVADGLYRDVLVTALREELLAVREHRLELELDFGHHDRVTGELRALTEQHPLREHLWELRILALYRCERAAEALACYRQLTRTLRTELGADPCRRLSELHDKILRKDTSLDLPHEDDPACVSAGHQPTVWPPRELPPDVPDFTARADETATIGAALADVPKDGTAARIAVISGPGGMGKSTLAVHVAHQLRDQFTDGELVADLNGYGGHVPSTDDILADFLRSLGVPGTAIPPGTAARSALFRSRTAQLKLLLVLDNALSEAQVRPLLPTGSHCAVIVTSRGKLPGLGGVHRCELGTFTQQDALRFLARSIGNGRTGTDRGAAEQLAQLCGGMPLALRIAAARLIDKPHWYVDDLVAKMRQARRPLAELTFQDLDLRSSLALSVRGLSAPALTLFRRTAVVPAPDYPGWVAAALTDVDLETGDAMLEELIDARLVETERSRTTGTPRYRSHNLVRSYAAELLAAEPDAETAAATERALGGWLALAERAHAAVYGNADYTILHGGATRWYRDGLAERLDIPLRPMSWLDDERLSLRSAVQLAGEHDLDELAWDLAWTSVTLYEARGYFDDWAQSTDLALDACRRAGNARGEGALLQSAASRATLLDDDPTAARLQRRAAAIFERIGDAHGSAISRQRAAISHWRGRRYTESCRAYTAAAAAAAEVGDTYLEAASWRGCAQVLLLRGELAEAETCVHRALALYRASTSRRGELQGMHVLGEVRLKQRRYADARLIFDRFLQIARQIGEVYGETYALAGLGESLLALGDFSQAEPILRQAVSRARQFNIAQVETRGLDLIADAVGL
jgi:DNA-binding SARP family transcriptional activator